MTSGMRRLSQETALTCLSELWSPSAAEPCFLIENGDMRRVRRDAFSAVGRESKGRVRPSVSFLLVWP